MRTFRSKLIQHVLIRIYLVMPDCVLAPVGLEDAYYEERGRLQSTYNKKINKHHEHRTTYTASACIGSESDDTTAGIVEHLERALINVADGAEADVWP